MGPLTPLFCVKNHAPSISLSMTLITCVIRFFLGYMPQHNYRMKILSEIIFDNCTMFFTYLGVWLAILMKLPILKISWVALSRASLDSFLTHTNAFYLDVFGQLFTWKKRIHTYPVYERLDRAMARNEWSSIYPNAFEFHEIFTCSDHCPIIASTTMP